MEKYNVNFIKNLSTNDIMDMSNEQLKEVTKKAIQKARNRYNIGLKTVKQRLEENPDYAIPHTYSTDLERGTTRSFGDIEPTENPKAYRGKLIHNLVVARDFLQNKTARVSDDWEKSTKYEIDPETGEKKYAMYNGKFVRDKWGHKVLKVDRSKSGFVANFMDILVEKTGVAIRKKDYQYFTDVYKYLRQNLTEAAVGGKYEMWKIISEYVVDRDFRKMDALELSKEIYRIIDEEKTGTSRQPTLDDNGDLVEDEYTFIDEMLGRK